MMLPGKLKTCVHCMLSCVLLCIMIADTSFANTGKTESKNWNFDVYLDGSRIGSHQFQLRDTGTHTEVVSHAQFDVKFLFFTAYSYRHQDRETWVDGCLSNINAITDDNGTQYTVTGESQQNQFIINNSPLPGSAPCIKTFAYWDKDFLNEDILLNSQTGELVKVSSVYLGKETIKVNDRKIISDKYQLTGTDIDINLWYTEDGHWIRLQSTTSDGNTISYQLEQDDNS